MSFIGGFGCNSSTTYNFDRSGNFNGFSITTSNTPGGIFGDPSGSMIGADPFMSGLTNPYSMDSLMLDPFMGSMGMDLSMGMPLWDSGLGLGMTSPLAGGFPIDYGMSGMMNGLGTMFGARNYPPAIMPPIDPVAALAIGNSFTPVTEFNRDVSFNDGFWGSSYNLSEGFRDGGRRGTIGTIADIFTGIALADRAAPMLGRLFAGIGSLFNSGAEATTTINWSHIK